MINNTNYNQVYLKITNKSCKICVYARQGQGTRHNNAHTHSQPQKPLSVVVVVVVVVVVAEAVEAAQKKYK
jgi:hypothetical protein